MKTIAIIFSMLTFFALSSNAQSKKVAKIMDNPEARIEVYNNIMNNHELMLEFMEMMKGNEHAMMMMQNGNLLNGEMNAKKGMAEMKCNHQMMGNTNRMGMMKDNPEMKTAMVEECNTNSNMHSMAEMMAQNPEMMNTCMKMMGNRNEETSNSVNEQEHLEHHE
ncbi:hypothetical protein [Sunxiuqinia indica]|uniref:hypothetical protein n=1 Tax=Sunxiuqinia indica TaxID=2692584 RepID=UPI00135A9436|nr:hypothetical protein [Sunxiuqinia indica]